MKEVFWFALTSVMPSALCLDERVARDEAALGHSAGAATGPPVDPVGRRVRGRRR